ncbi:MAG TPA: GNAT family N-acetyltransferase [Dehalococcoidia bacterium]|nr:GNAT family N-acetyltransferase [Dehalococcoidia bacterium]
MSARADAVDSGVVLRPARAEEADALVAMINAAYHKTEGHVFPGTTRTEREDVTRRLPELTVAEADGTVAGCIHVTLSPPEAHFGLLAVDVARHGQGIGSQLIAHAERVARAAGCETMRIEAVKEGGQVPYYERRGYRVAAEHAGQEWNGSADWGAAIDWHMVEMEKPLR